MARSIQTIIADDEPLAREAIRLRLDEVPDFEVVGEAADGQTAVRLVKDLHADLILLDLEMPRLHGLKVLQRLARHTLPAVVVLTAHREYGPEAFDAQAVDYIVKPITDDRFRAMLDRVRSAVAASEAEKGGGFAAEAPTVTKPRYLVRLPVRQKDGIVIVRMDDVRWISSAGNYVELHLRDTRYTVRSTLTALEARLDPTQFTRIHRATIIKVDCIHRVYSTWNGDFDIRLDDGTTLRMSRTYRDRVLSYAR